MKYRLLNQKDIIKSDDEFLDDDCINWKRIDSMSCEWCVGMSPGRALKPLRRELKD